MKMRAMSFWIFLLMGAQPAFTQYECNQSALPEGAKARLGRGAKNNMAYSPDGKLIAVATPIGIWLYDAHLQADLALLTDHTDDVYEVVFSPDGKTLASASQDSTVKLWDVATGHPSHTLTDHTDAVYEVAFSPDGKTLASASRDGTVQLWDVATGHPSHTLTGRHSDIAFSPDGKTLASASTDSTVQLWDVATGHPSHTLIFSATIGSKSRYIREFEFSSDGKMLADKDGTGRVAIWDVATGQLNATLTDHMGRDRYNFSFSVFSPDGKTLASKGAGHTVQLWDVATGQLNATLDHTDYVRGFSFSPDGKTLASASRDSTVQLWDVATGQLNATLTDHTDAVYEVAFSPDGKTLVGEGWGLVASWDVTTGQLKTFYGGHSSYGNDVAFSPSDGQTLAVGSSDIVLWNTTTGAIKRLSLRFYTNNVTFSPDGNTLVTTGSGKKGMHLGLKVYLYDIASDTLKAVFDDTSPKKENCIGAYFRSSFSLDGNTLVVPLWACDSEDVHFWDVTTGQLNAKLYYPNSDEARSAVLSPDGSILAGGSVDGNVYLYDVATGQLNATLTGHTDYVYDVSFSPNGKTLASASEDHTVQLWDVATGQLNATLTGHTDYVYDVSFSPDGKTLASASEDHTVQLWDVATGQLNATLTGQREGVYSVAFSPDGSTLASGGTIVLLWDFSQETGNVVASAELPQLSDCGSPVPFLETSQPALDVQLSSTFTPNGDGINDLLQVSFTTSNTTTPHVAVYDLTGYRRAALHTDQADSQQSYTWSGRDTNGALVAPGLYLLRVKIGKHTTIRPFSVAY